MTGLFCFDLEGTLVQAELFEEAAKLLGKEQLAEMTRQAMNSETGFETALMARAAELKGLPEKTLAEIAVRMPLLPQAPEMTSMLQRKGHKVAIITGAFRQVAEILAARLNVSSVYCHEIETENGMLTGKAKTGYADKADILRKLANETTPDFTVAVGDGANDAGMLREADISIALNAKQAARENAAICIDTSNAMDIARLFIGNALITIDQSVHPVSHRIASAAGKIRIADTTEASGDTEALIIRTRTRATKEYIDQHPSLKVIATATTGTDHIDIEYAKERGITVIDAAGENADAVAEYTIRAMLKATDGIFHTSELLKQGKDFSRTKAENRRTEIKGKTLGIIGLGAIGTRVQRIADAMGMKTKAYDPYNPKAAHTLPEVMESGIITLHAALTSETSGMIGKKELGMARGAILINAARGELIDEDALTEALTAGQIRAAVLDVFINEPRPSRLYSLSNTICTPHIAGNSEEAKRNAAKKAACLALLELSRQKKAMVKA